MHPSASCKYAPLEKKTECVVRSTVLTNDASIFQCMQLRRESVWKYAKCAVAFHENKLTQGFQGWNKFSTITWKEDNVFWSGQVNFKCLGSLASVLQTVRWILTTWNPQKFIKRHSEYILPLPWIKSIFHLDVKEALFQRLHPFWG